MSLNRLRQAVQWSRQLILYDKAKRALDKGKELRISHCWAIETETFQPVNNNFAGNAPKTAQHFKQDYLGMKPKAWVKQEDTSLRKFF